MRVCMTCDRGRSMALCCVGLEREIEIRRFGERNSLRRLPGHTSGGAVPSRTGADLAKVTAVWARR